MQAAPPLLLVWLLLLTQHLSLSALEGQLSRVTLQVWGLGWYVSLGESSAWDCHGRGTGLYGASIKSNINERQKLWVSTTPLGITYLKLTIVRLIWILIYMKITARDVIGWSDNLNVCKHQMWHSLPKWSMCDTVRVPADGNCVDCMSGKPELRSFSTLPNTTSFWRSIRCKNPVGFTCNTFWWPNSLTFFQNDSPTVTKHECRHT